MHVHETVVDPRSLQDAEEDGSKEMEEVEI